MRLDFLLNQVRETVKRHELECGAYSRVIWQAGDGQYKLGVNEYGCADAVNILYMLGDLPRDTEVRQAHIQMLQSFQNPETGVFDEGSHHPLHCTAHCTAALELFDALPLYPMKGFHEYCTKEGLECLLAHLKWSEDPWRGAHQGAGVYAALVLNGEVPREWQDWYFDWLTSHTDTKYGMGMEGAIETGIRPTCEHLNGWFHYLFNYHFAHQPFPEIEKLIDTCIDLYKKDELGQSFGKIASFREIDWVFTLNRSVMQSGYRYAEAKELLRDFAGKYIRNLEKLDFEKDASWNDLHQVFGAVCAVAELQITLPGELQSEYPLKQVLDRRPFI